MKPAPFQYVAAKSVDDAIALLSKYGADAKLIAGGQSLVPMMNFRLARPEWLIDINRIDGLAGITQQNGMLRIGSLTRYSELEASEAVQRGVPLLRQMLPHIAHEAIRNRGTIGGSICHADPAAEMPVAMLALDATFELRGPSGARRVAADDFFLGQMTTGIEADEVLVAIKIPETKNDERHGFSEFARRRGDFALASAAVVLRFNGGMISDHVRIAVGGLSERAERARKAEALLAGKTLTPTLIEEAAHTASGEVQAGQDLHATEAYRRSLIATQVKQALAVAADRTSSTGAKK
ncbi:MAG: xanthine dehydrogenase family protein subunit M [Xanthobacteraceae bacterium]|nr:xanthine dehydrogenase family protein subunit M [Xanthobacteraceae bacterium]MCW5674542.1 xanthine dehydrogenase family protein subunit M [Xanthobacteraceae bacterium]